MDADPAPLSGSVPALSGKRIVITRSKMDNHSLASELTALGAIVIEVPLVEVFPPEDAGAALRSAAAQLADYRWVILTSVNGVNALHEAMGERPWPDGTTVVPVGPTTQAAAAACGMDVISPPETATVSSIVQSFPEWDGSSGRRVLAPLAELAGHSAADGLSAKGYEVDRVTSYRTGAPASSQPEPKAVAGQIVHDGEPALGGADAVTFFSPSVIDRYVDRFGINTIAAVVVCIGPSTIDCARRHRIDGAIMANPHTAAGVITALSVAFDTGADSSSDSDPNSDAG